MLSAAAPTKQFPFFKSHRPHQQQQFDLAGIEVVFAGIFFELF
jgi:hypothetical protein